MTEYEDFKKLFDEYCFVTSETTKISDRLQTISEVYISLNTLLLTGIAYVLVFKGFTSWLAFDFLVFITLLELPINCTWLFTAQSYNKVINVRLQYQAALERQLRADHDVPLYIHYKKEARGIHRGVLLEEMRVISKNKPRFILISIETFLIILFLVAFPIITTGFALHLIL